MVDILLKRYLWLVDTLRTKEEMTYEEISSAWGRSSLNDNGSTLSKRTLYNHCQAICKHFNIEIACRRGRNLNYYYIVNPEIFSEANVNSWLFENFSISSILADNHDLSDKILLEEIPSGRKYLSDVLTALRNNRIIRISYRNFSGRGYDDIEVEPLCVKLFKRRWYMMVRLTSNEYLRIFALDRITAMDLTKRQYVYPADFNPAEFFSPYFGITAFTGEKAEIIKMRAYGELQGYLKSLPMHHSQKIVEERIGLHGTLR